MRTRAFMIDLGSNEEVGKGYAKGRFEQKLSGKFPDQALVALFCITTACRYSYFFLDKVFYAAIYAQQNPCCNVFPPLFPPIS